MIKSYEVVGYAVEGDLLCCACAESWATKAGVDLEDPEQCEFGEVAPLFADECGEEALFCGACDSQIW